MAQEELTRQDLDRSEALVAELLAADFPIGFAGWLKDRDLQDESWRFFLATPLWDVDGPLKTVSLLDRFIELRGRQFGMTMHDIEVGPSEALQMKAIRDCIRIDGGGRTALENNTLNGLTIDSPAVFVSQPSKFREKVKAARRNFEEHLSLIEAA